MKPYLNSFSEGLAETLGSKLVSIVAYGAAVREAGVHERVPPAAARGLGQVPLLHAHDLQLGRAGEPRHQFAGLPHVVHDEHAPQDVADAYASLGARRGAFGAGARRAPRPRRRSSRRRA